MGNAPYRAELAHRSKTPLTVSESAKATGYRDTRLKATELQGCFPRALRPSPPSALALPHGGFQFPSCFLLLSLARNRHSFLLYLHTSWFISFQVCLPRSFELLLKAHALLWAFPLGLRALWGWCSLRCSGVDTGTKGHYKSRRVQEDHGQGMEPVSSDMTSFGFLFFWWYDSFWRFLGGLHSFLLLSIQPRFIEHVLCIRHFFTWHLQRSSGNHSNHVTETCLPKYNRHVCA